MATFSSELRIAGAVYLAHPALADRLEDLVVTEVGALLQHCHRPALPRWFVSFSLMADARWPMADRHSIPAI